MRIQVYEPASLEVEKGTHLVSTGSGSPHQKPILLRCSSMMYHLNTWMRMKSTKARCDRCAILLHAKTRHHSDRQPTTAPLQKQTWNLQWDTTFKTRTNNMTWIRLHRWQTASWTMHTQRKTFGTDGGMANTRHVTKTIHLVILHFCRLALGGGLSLDKMEERITAARTLKDQSVKQNTITPAKQTPG